MSRDDLEQSERQPSTFGGMDARKRLWLNTLGLPSARSVSDCDPTDWLVQLDDGSVHQVCQMFSRVMGYFQPTFMWNVGKQAEHRERKHFVERRDERR